jgi:hypothetical protein
MFAAIDVSIDWRLGLENCPAGAVRITLSHTVPPHVRSETLAYAMPYEGGRIAILLPRFDTDSSLTRARALMAHVMAHEIAHILQGIDRHSQSGLMKAHWSLSERIRMVSKPLPFTDDDILLIHKGLAERAARLESSTRVGQ